jgi:riboflavin kinase/FMN adenylyltransferase
MSNDTKYVLAIGNFDGVHKGHAALLRMARAIADDKGLKLRVLTFEPHPRQFFDPNAKPFRVTLESAKTRLLKFNKVDDVQIAVFNAELAGTSAANFIDHVIVRDMNAAHVVVGDDFHFGKGRSGHVDTLMKDGRFGVTPITLVTDVTDAISSTRIRQAIAAGDIASANAMLGWNWGIEGVVEHGDKRGRELGYPTANIALGDTQSPAYGIYAVWVDIGDGVARPGVANIGIRPMFEVQKPLLEAYLFDFDGDLYGKTLRVTPIQLIRPEAKFEGLDALKAQIAKDCLAARDILKS